MDSAAESNRFGGDLGLGIGLGPPTSEAGGSSEETMVVVEVVGVVRKGSVETRVRRTARVWRCLWSRSDIH